MVWLTQLQPAQTLTLAHTSSGLLMAEDQDLKHLQTSCLHAVGCAGQSSLVHLQLSLVEYRYLFYC